MDDPRSLQGQRKTDQFCKDGGGILPRVAGSTRVTAAGVEKENWPQREIISYALLDKYSGHIIFAQLACTGSYLTRIYKFAFNV